MVFKIKEYKLVTSWENEYGYTYLQKFVTEEGNILIWYGSTVIDFEKGSIKATVKAHNEREGIKQTIITRTAVA